MATTSNSETNKKFQNRPDIQTSLTFSGWGMGFGIAIAGIALGTGVLGHGYLTAKAIESQNFWQFLQNTEPFNFSIKGKEQDNGFVWKAETDQGVYTGGLKANPFGDEFELFWEFQESQMK